MCDLCVVQHEYGVRQRGGIRGLFYDGKVIHSIEAVSHAAPSSHSHPFDTALRAYSGQAVDLQEATSEPGIRVAEYCLVINQWHLPLWPGGDRQRSEVMLWVT
jgi:hypothetical protein